eukprot:11212948-Lingulodinium_polyedra.AAC.1
MHLFRSHCGPSTAPRRIMKRCLESANGKAGRWSGKKNMKMAPLSDYFTKVHDDLPSTEMLCIQDTIEDVSDEEKKQGLEAAVNVSSDGDIEYSSDQEKSWAADPSSASTSGAQSSQGDQDWWSWTSWTWSPSAWSSWYSAESWAADEEAAVAAEEAAQEAAKGSSSLQAMLANLSKGQGTQEDLVKTQAFFTDEIEKAKKKKAEEVGVFDDEQKELSDAIGEGVPSYGKWGTAFRRDKTVDHEAYKGLSTTAKKEFRKEWAESKLKAMTLKKTHARKYQEIDESCGEYLSFPNLVKACGGAEVQENYRAACNLASKCVLLGGKWISYNHMEERWEFLRMRRCYTERFSQSWSLYQQETEEMESTAALEKQLDNSKEEEAKQPNSSKEVEKPKSKAKAKAKNGKAKDKGSVAGGKEKSELDILLVECCKLKTKLSVAKQKAESITRAAMTDPSWHWANRHDQAALIEIKDFMKKACFDEAFDNEFLNMEMSYMRKKYKDAELSTKLGDLKVRLERAASELADEVECLTRTHIAREGK